jgi:hypothetical protein
MFRNSRKLQADTKTRNMAEYSHFLMSRALDNQPSPGSENRSVGGSIPPLGILLVVHNEQETRDLAVTASRAAFLEVIGFDDPMRRWMRWKPPPASVSWSRAWNSDLANRTAWLRRAWSDANGPARGSWSSPVRNMNPTGRASVSSCQCRSILTFW